MVTTCLRCYSGFPSWSFVRKAVCKLPLTIALKLAGRSEFTLKQKVFSGSRLLLVCECLTLPPVSFWWIGSDWLGVKSAAEMRLTGPPRPDLSCERKLLVKFVNLQAKRFEGRKLCL